MTLNINLRTDNDPDKVWTDFERKSYMLLNGASHNHPDGTMGATGFSPEDIKNMEKRDNGQFIKNGAIQFIFTSESTMALVVTDEDKAKAFLGQHSLQSFKWFMMDVSAGTYIVTPAIDTPLDTHVLNQALENYGMRLFISVDFKNFLNPITLLPK